MDAVKKKSQNASDTPKAAFGFWFINSRKTLNATFSFLLPKDLKKDQEKVTPRISSLLCENKIFPFTIGITENSIDVSFQKRAYNLLLLGAGIDKMQVKIPWLESRGFYP
jgi:hypothetical protein